MEPEIPVYITEVNTTVNYEIGDVIKRGQIIETEENEMLVLQIGDKTTLGLSENTRIELHKILTNDRVVKFTKGRIMINTEDDVPFVVETNFTENVLHKGSVSFVNYDFLEKIHIISITNSVQTNIKGSSEYMLIPESMEIKETHPVEYKKIEPNLNIGDHAYFYKWFKEIIDQN